MSLHPSTPIPLHPTHAAIITGSFLSGAMMDLSLLVIPVLLDTNPNQAHQLATQWVRVYHYGHRIYPALAISTCLLYGYAAWTQREETWRVWAVAAGLTLGMIPFTWVFMAPTNGRLFEAQRRGLAGVEGKEGGGEGAVRGLVGRWRRLHFVRALFPLAGAVVGLGAAFGVLVF